MPLSFDFQRRLFDVGDPQDGPTLVAVGGIHGDEPAGVEALERFRRVRPTLAGRMIGFVGNIPALRRGTRFIDVDLNRCWTEAGIRQAQEHPTAASEHVQLVELLDLLQKAWSERSPRHPFVVLDLHTTSGFGPPFAMLSTREDEIAFGRLLPIVKVVGIEQYVSGALLSYLSGWGAISMGFEGGQHQDPDSVQHHEALLWVAAAHLGLVELDEEGPWSDRLRRASPPLPGEIRVVHRHRVHPGDAFRMRPGHYHLERITEGHPIADDATGPIRAPASGYLLMPSYGAKGEDGFFVGRAE